MTISYFAAAMTPFRVGVHFDGDEVYTQTALNKATGNENESFPSGSVGFGLYYVQS